MGSKVHSFLKQCFARSSVEQNNVLQLMSAEEGFVKVPWFDLTEDRENTVSKINGL